MPTRILESNDLVSSTLSFEQDILASGLEKDYLGRPLHHDQILRIILAVQETTSRSVIVIKHPPQAPEMANSNCGFPLFRGT